MTDEDQRALDKAGGYIQSARKARGSKAKLLMYYWNAKKSLEKVDEKKADAAALTGKVVALRELAAVLDLSGEQERAARCRQKADTLSQELDKNKESCVPVLPSLNALKGFQEVDQTRVIDAISMTDSAAATIDIPSTFRQTPLPSPPAVISLSAATSIQRSTKFFTKDVYPAPIQCSLPGPDEQLQSTYQLVHGLQLLQDSVHEQDLSPEALQWRHSTRNNLDEKDRLQTIAVQIVQTFRSNATKDATAVAEVVQLAPVLDSEYSRLLLTSFTDTICQSQHLHVHLVAGLVNVIQGAAHGSISSNDLVVVLQSLFKKLQSTHPESTRDRHHLLLAISQVLDAMADADIGSLDRDALHGPLKDLLRELESSKDPYLTFQAEYAAQALLSVPDDESVLKAGFRRVWSGLKVVAGFANILDPSAIKDSLEALENLYESGKGGTRLLKDLRNAIKNNDHPTFSMKEGLRFKKAWYDALRRAEICIKAGGLVEFRNLVTTASYRHQFEFQWGICQLLGRFATNTRWDLEARKEAIVFIGELYKDSELWNRQEGVDQVIFDILTNVTTNDGASFEGAMSLLKEMKKQSPALQPKFNIQSPLWNSFRPSDSAGYTTAKFTLLKTVQIQYPWKPRLYGIHKALKAYHAPELVIRRVSGDTLDLETCFVNLAIVEAPAHRQKEKEDLKEQAAVFHRLQSFEKVENTNTDAVIPLEQLFNKRKLPKRGNEVEDVPRRILVQGRAGIGKTTLCKKLVHAHQNGLWRNLFDVILWIPLRSLRGFTGTTLESLFRDKIFVGEDHDQRQAALSEALATCAKQGKVLFILDGMDEIVADTESEERHTFRRFLMTLLVQQYVVVTSRPSGVDSSLLQSTDLELETVGFSRQNVQDFVVKVLDSEGAASVQNFIRRTPLIQGLVNIPVQLDVICFSWDSLPKDVSRITMTGLYQLMVQRLCRKDAVRLKKKVGKILLTDQRLRSYSPKEMENVMETELLHLGYLAFRGMANRHQIEFEEKDLRQAFGELQENSALNQPLTPEDLVDIVKQTSFLHTADVDLSSQNANFQQAWHFLHLTFQEYFAATWIVRHFHLKQEYLPAKMMSKDQLADFVHQHKYNPQYEIVWSMVAGLLEGEALLEFFGILQGAPRDLIGGRHQLILASCFNEAHGRLDSKYSKKVDEELRKWLRFEMQTLDHDKDTVSGLGSQLSFPEASLINTLGSVSSWRSTLARTLGARSIMSDDAITFLVVSLDDNDKRVRSSAASALGKHPQLPGSVITALIAALKDKDEDVRTSAATALSKQSPLPESVIHYFVAALHDENKHVRSAAARGLVGCSVLPEYAIQALIAAFKDGDWLGHLPSVAAFSNQYTFPEIAIQPTISALKDQVPSVRLETASVSSKHSISRETSIRPLITLIGAKDGNPVLVLNTSLFTAPTSVKPLIDALKDEDKSVRSAAARALGGRSELPESAVGSLIDALKDEDKSVRSASAYALGNQSKLPESAIGSLVGALQDEKENVMYMYVAAKALGNQSLLPKSAIGSLVDLLKDGYEFVRSTSAYALGNQSKLPESAIGSLVDALKDESGNVRSEVAKALGKQSELPESAIESLVDAIKDRDERVRSAAKEALGNQSELSESAVGSLVHALRDGEKYVRSAAARVLGKQSELPESAVESLVDALKDEYGDSRSAAARALGNRSGLLESVLGSFIGTLQDEEKNVINAAAKALGNQSELPESAIRFLVDAVRDGEMYVRSAAAKALGNQSELPESAIRSLVGALRDGEMYVRSAAVTALGNQSELPESAIRSLVDALKDEYEVVRFQAVRELGNQSALSESAVGSLVDALKDEDEHVRFQAVRALGNQPELPELVVHFLIALLKDGHKAARIHASQVLQQHSHSIRVALPQLSKDDIESVYESFLFQYSCRRVLSLQVQDGRLRIHTEKREISENIDSDVQEKILSAFRAIHDKQGLEL
ncbi:hypothetical protein EMPS_09879 [Entomortierella parvispora]|uniref:NACHT domain-containing protein n=1 Tax=Entomortierella parvispora TaxID=205924 RepID=A0A9P3HIV3_9FUNG|nr:hypothetical protein EMPS_09879 [Entomortierella parvispora]